MSAVPILVVLWAWALLPPLLANRRSRQDPVDAFARFQARDQHLRPLPRTRRVDPVRRRAQVLAALLALDAAALLAWLLLQDRRALAAASAGIQVTVAWYGLAVRRRLAGRRPAPLAPVLPLSPRRPVLAPAA